jgi:hypothetical protein
MKNLIDSGFRIVVLAAAFISTPGIASGQSAANEAIGPFRTQTIQLEAGWNAVYLEIEPRKTGPDELFAGTPIEIVAAYNRPVTSMQFIESPNAVLPDRKTWNVWYAPQREDALLSNLGAIQAHHAYLVFTEQAYTWSLEGTPFFSPPRWHPNAYNLVGFPIHTAEQPTIANFFAGAKAHTPLKIYQMTGGQWSLVTQPAQALVKPGAAYWVYSEGASDFRGPLEVTFPGSATGGIVFSESADARQIQIRNVSSFPQELTLTLQAGSTGLLPLSYVVTVLDGPNTPVDKVSVPFQQGLQIGPIEAGAAFTMDFEVVHEAVTSAIISSTLTIVSDSGSRVEIPVVSLRADLLTTP